MTETHMSVTAHQVEKLHTQLAFLLRDGQHYRTVLTDSESSDGVMLVCTSPEHPADDQLAQWGVYNCCNADVFMELHHEKRAAFFVSATIAIPALLAEREQLKQRAEKAEARLRAVQTCRVWNDDLGRGRVFADDLRHAVDPELYPEPVPVRLDSDAAVLALVQARAATDNGNRTPLADVLAEHGMTEDDMEVEG